MKRKPPATRETASPAPERQRIFLIEDHTLFREGLKRLILDEEDLEICGEAASAKDVFNRIDQAKPDLVLLDISLPGADGLELVKSLKVQRPGICMMAVSMHAEEMYAERVLRAGAKGYIMKQASASELVTAIRTVLSGGVYLSPSLSKRLLQSLVSHKNDGKSGIDQLSDRELEVFRYLGRGFTTGEIAEALGVSVKTVESHRGNIRYKLKLGSGSELLRLAIAHVSEAPQSIA